MSVSKLSEEMAKAGCTVEVFTTTANGTEELTTTPNSRHMLDGVIVTYFKRVTKDHTHFSPDLLKRLRREIKDFDIVHIHAWWNFVSLLSCLIAIKSGVPVVISPRGTLSTYSFSNRNTMPKQLIHHLLGKYLLRKSFIHVTSDHEGEAILKLTEQKGIFNIPNFIKLPKRQMEMSLPEGSLKMIFFSRIEEKKGLEILFEALKAIDISYSLTIAGEGTPSYIGKLKKLAKDNNLENHLEWIGFRKEDKFDILQRHHLMVLPSYDESFGNVVIESLSVGTAVLLSENVGLSRYVEDNIWGWICENNPAALKSGIERANKERAKLIEIRETAPFRIEKDFNETYLKTRYLNMYHQILKNG